MTAGKLFLAPYCELLAVIPLCLWSSFEGI